MKQAILFDLDGTLWNATERLAISWNAEIVAAGYPELCVDVPRLQSVQGMTLDAIGERFFPDLTANEREALVNRCEDRAIADLAIHGGALYPCLVETLKHLSSRYLLAVVSNCSDGYIDAFLDAHDLRGLFDDYECAGRTGKPKGDNIALVIERNGVDRALYVGDTILDAQAAKAAGVTFVYARYGFGTVEEYAAVIDVLADIESAADTLLSK